MPAQTSLDACARFPCLRNNRSSHQSRTPLKTNSLYIFIDDSRHCHSLNNYSLRDQPRFPYARAPEVVGSIGETICPTSGRNIISSLSVRAYDNRIIPVGLDPSDLFFDLKFVGTEIAPEVSFKVNNPFDFNVNMMIQHHIRPTGSTRGALDPKCVGRLDEPSCQPVSPDVTAGCIRAEMILLSRWSVSSSFRRILCLAKGVLGSNRTNVVQSPRPMLASPSLSTRSRLSVPARASLDTYARFPPLYHKSRPVALAVLH